MLEIELHNDSSALDIPDIDVMRQWLEAALLDQTSYNTHVLIRLVDLEESESLNLAYRDKAKPTNVLSFAEEEIPGFPATSMGTLVICPEVLEREAKELTIKKIEHWAHLLIHGMLHLQGHDHIEENEAEEMEALEIKILAKFNINNPYS